MSTTLKECGNCKFAFGPSVDGVVIEGECALMPRYSSDRNVSMYDSCKFLSMGRSDVVEIIRRKKYELEESERMITSLESQIKKLQSLDLESLRLHATEIPELGIGYVYRESPFGKTREPAFHQHARDMKKGETDYHFCGWCQHSTGLSKFSCTIEGRCELMIFKDERPFDTPCPLIQMSEDEISLIVSEKNREILREQKKIEVLELKISVLESLELKDIPPLPQNRHYDHFNISDEAMVFIGEEGEIGRWERGVVVNGYRHHDGCVSVNCDKKIHNGEFMKGHGFGGGLCIPTIMLKSEYDWFVENPDDFANWISKCCEVSYNGKYFSAESFPTPTSFSEFRSFTEVEKEAASFLGDVDLRISFMKMTFENESMRKEDFDEEEMKEKISMFEKVFEEVRSLLDLSLVSRSDDVDLEWTLSRVRTTIAN